MALSFPVIIGVRSRNGTESSSVSVTDVIVNVPDTKSQYTVPAIDGLCSAPSVLLKNAPPLPIGYPPESI